MIVDEEVVPGQRPERLPAAVTHVDVHVHPARPEQRRVEAVLVVGGEDDDALLAGGRPQTVDEVEQPGQGDAALRGRSLDVVHSGTESSELALEPCSIVSYQSQCHAETDIIHTTVKAGLCTDELLIVNDAVGLGSEFRDCLLLT